LTLKTLRRRIKTIKTKTIRAEKVWIKTNKTGEATFKSISNSEPVSSEKEKVKQTRERKYPKSEVLINAAGLAIKTERIREEMPEGLVPSPVFILSVDRNDNPNPPKKTDRRREAREI